MSYYKAQLEKTFDFQKAMDELEKSIERCRVRYEMYFSGVEPREPVRMRQDLQNKLARLRREQTRNVGDRFRREALASRIAVLSRYWDRINKARENGTYYKDRIRTKRLIKKMSAKDENEMLKAAAQISRQNAKDDTPDAPVYNLEDLNKADPGGVLSVQQQKMAKARDAAEQRPQAAKLPEQRMQQIFQSYVAAKTKCNEDTSRVSYKAVVQTIEKQIPRLRQKGYRDIDFKVVIKEGKASLKAVGKKTKNA